MYDHVMFMRVMMLVMSLSRVVADGIQTQPPWTIVPRISTKAMSTLKAEKFKTLLALFILTTGPCFVKADTNEACVKKAHLKASCLVRLGATKMHATLSELARLEMMDCRGKSAWNRPSLTMTRFAIILLRCLCAKLLVTITWGCKYLTVDLILETSPPSSKTKLAPAYITASKTIGA
jgi:hypothetical protein